MKNIITLIGAATVALAFGQASGALAISQLAEQYSITEAGLHHRVWQRVEYEMTADGRQVPHIHSYTELATGMYYTNTQGQLVESKEEIEILPNGAGAIARQGQHKAIFPANLQNGSVELNTPDGKWLRGRILGLSYDDYSTGDTVLIAELKDADGVVLGSNVVLYRDAFTDVQADVRYTYKRGSFEQDVILRQMPPSPAEYGLNPQTTKLQVLTEFFEPPTPKKRVHQRDGVMDEDLDFGMMKIGRGRAFSLEDENSPQSQTRDVSVSKRWLKLEGRDFLIEEVPMIDVQTGGSGLRNSEGASLDPVPGSVRHVVSKTRLLPAVRTAKRKTDAAIKLSFADVDSRPGYVLDYQSVTTDTNFTFKADMTYYVNGEVYLSGDTVIEGGTVVKYNPTTAGWVYQTGGTLKCWTDTYRPAVFTSKNDDAVGEPISGSSGSPSVYDDANYYLIVDDVDPVALKHLRLLYCYVGLTPLSGAIEMSDIQFAHSAYPIYGGATSAWALRNVLMYDITEIALEFYGCNLGVEHLTVNQCNQFWQNDGGASLAVTNSLLVSVTNWGGAFSAENNATNSSGIGVFQTVGAGSHYLATNSVYRNAGTTNINGTLLANLQSLTTYPPIVYSNVTLWVPTTLNPQAQRDTDLPDLGYHYDPLDYAFGGCDASNSLTFTAGTAVGWFHTSSGFYHASHGIHIGDQQIVWFDGTAEAPTWWVRASAVQEGNSNWSGGYGTGGITSWADQSGSITNAGQVWGNFLKVSALTTYDNSFRDDNGLMIGRFKDCEFYAGGEGAYVTSYYFTNCLFFRSTLGLSEGRPGNEMYIRNCTFYGNAAYLSASHDPVYYLVEDSSFDGVTLNMGGYGSNPSYSTYGYNAYTNSSNPFGIGGTGDVSSTTFDWRSGPLGDFYLPDGSSLIDVGSRYADEAGLYHYTTTTNLIDDLQINETNSIVDIGYHYVAGNQNGDATDTDGDGSPDYVEDSNGDGSVSDGETAWQDLTDWGLRVVITRPKSGTLIP